MRTVMDLAQQSKLLSVEKIRTCENTLKNAKEGESLCA